MDNSPCIFQCGNRLTEDTATDEHVVLNAIGGRKTVTGFICNTCNSKTGSIWDAELAGQLNPLSLLLGIKRHRGTVPSQKFPTSNGGAVEMCSDGKRTIAKPSHTVTAVGNTIHLKISARSRDELRKLLKGWQRKYPSLRNKNLDELMSGAQARALYSSDWTQFDLEFLNEKAKRSLVKSAVALVYDAGIDPRVCALALDYLTKDNVKPCCGYYYDKDRDLVVDRPKAKPFHCVYVKGNPGTGTILGYVEFYGLHRMVLCLSESYAGKAFTNLYAIDPVKGKELLLDIDLNLPIFDVRSILDDQKCDEKVLKTAIDRLFGYIMEADFKREFRRAKENAWKRAFESFNAGKDECLTDEDIRQLVARFIEELTPFLRHNIERFRHPPRDFSASSKSHVQ